MIEMDWKKVLGIPTKHDKVIMKEVKMIFGIKDSIYLFNKYSKYLEKIEPDDIETTKRVMDEFQKMMEAEAEKFKVK